MKQGERVGKRERKTEREGETERERGREREIGEMGIDEKRRKSNTFDQDKFK